MQKGQNVIAKADSILFFAGSAGTFKYSAENTYELIRLAIEKLAFMDKISVFRGNKKKAKP